MPININNIRTYMNTWKNYTYRQGVDYIHNLEGDVKSVVIEVLEIQQLSEKNMNGNSVMNLPHKFEDYTDIIFSNIFWKQVNDGYVTPASFIVEIVKKCLEKQMHDSVQIAGIVGRGFRSFPSFVRELDLAYKLSRKMSGVELTGNPEQDVVDHTDILVHRGNCDYRVWSYQSTQRGIENTKSRFVGKRGAIPKGMHVLCPIDIGANWQIETLDGWYFYSESLVEQICKVFEDEPFVYSGIMKMGDEKIMEFMKKTSLVKKEG